MKYKVTTDIQHVWIEPVPDVDDILPLTAIKHAPLVQADRSIEVQPEPDISLLRFTTKHLQASAGLLNRIVTGLKQAGHDVVISDQRPDWLALAAHPGWYEVLRDMPFTRKLVPDLAILEQFDATDRELLNAVAAASQGQIIVQDNGSAARLMAMICRLFPRANILIPAATRQKVWQLKRALAKQLEEPVQAVFGQEWNHSCRIAVCNMQRFEYICPEDWSIILYPSEQEATHRITIDRVVPYLDEHRSYAFVADTSKLNQRATLRLEAASGTVIYRQPVRLSARPVQVFVTHSPAMPTLPRYDKPTAIERKQQLFWGNDIRNDAVANIAQAFAAEDMAALWKLGLMLQEQEDWFEQRERGLSVVILVEVVEHARQLQQRLPGWSIASKAPGSLKEQQARTMSDWHLLDRAIVTSVYAEQEGVNADVIIRADGTAAGWNVNCGPFSDNKNDPLVIIDLLDDLDERAKQDTLRRIQDYELRGWPVAGVPDSLRGPITYGKRIAGNMTEAYSS